MNETIEHNGYKIVIRSDDYPLDPIEDFIDLPIFYCFHRRYKLGHPHKLSCDEVQEIADNPDNIALPLYMYDHGSITISTKPFACRWDSGQLGYVVMPAAAIAKEWSGDRDKALAYLLAQVETYDLYLRGEVYWYEIVSPNSEVIDSCSGYYGSDFEKSGLLESARAAIDWHLKEYREA